MGSDRWKLKERRRGPGHDNRYVDWNEKKCEMMFWKTHESNCFMTEKTHSRITVKHKGMQKKKDLRKKFEVIFPLYAKNLH